MLATVTSIAGLRSAILPWRQAGETVALVPTMGALHDGHLSLIAAAKASAKRVAATIFVNPLQFAAHEDLAKYPRNLDRDRQLLTGAGCDLLYAPDAAVMYPQGFATSIEPGPLGTMLEGQFRPGHFQGVATVVSKLLLQALPDVALFGEKDYQQLQVIGHVTRDLDLPVKIVGVPTLRDSDGLALSSRNVYLSADERKTAVALPNVMRQIAAGIESGAEVAAALGQGVAQLKQAGFRVDYLALADAATLEPVTELSRPARLLAAAHLGATRLIDNLAVGKFGLTGDKN